MILCLWCSTQLQDNEFGSRRRAIHSRAFVHSHKWQGSKGCPALPQASDKVWMRSAMWCLQHICTASRYSNCDVSRWSLHTGVCSHCRCTGRLLHTGAALLLCHSGFAPIREPVGSTARSSGRLGSSSQQATVTMGWSSEPALVRACALYHQKSSPTGRASTSPTDRPLGLTGSYLMPAWPAEPA